VAQPTARLEVAGADGLQEYPPKAMTGYETYMEGHGVFRASASSEYIATGALRYTYGAYDPSVDFTGATGHVWMTEFDAFNPNAVGGDTFTDSGGGTHTGHWNKLELPYKLKPSYLYYKNTGTYTTERCASDWVILASNDDNTWDLVHTSTTVLNTTLTIPINSTKAYKYLQFLCKTINGGTSLYVQQIAYFGTPAPSSLEDGHLTLGKALTAPRLSGHGAGAETPRADRLVVHYDTTVDSVVSGSTVVDISGNGLNGTLKNGASYSSSERALTFDAATNQYITATTTNQTGAFVHTVSMWMKFSELTDNQHFLLSFGSTTADGFTAIGMYYSSNNGIRVSSGVDYRTKFHPTPGEWVHVTYTYSGGTLNQAASDVNVKFYVNGVRWPFQSYYQSGSVTPAALNLPGTNTLQINGRNGVNNIFVDMSVANFKLYNVALTAEEVAQEYALGRTGKSLNVTDTAVCLGGTVPRAQLDVRGSAVFGGNVGIGTTSPSSALQISGTSEPVTLNIMNENTDGASEIKLSERGSVSDERYGFNIVYDGSDYYGFGSNKFHILNRNATTTPSRAMTIDRVTGNVGIGRSDSSAYPLIVEGVIYSNGLRVYETDTSEAVIKLLGSAQGTGRVFVGQSDSHGGGIEYNGNNSPASTGAGSDYITLYRVQDNVYAWTARNVYNSAQWEFRTAINNSDDRVKENEKYIRGATDTLMKIKPQLYDKKPSIESTDTKEWLCESGLIAQELYYDVPELRHLVKIPRDARDIDMNVSITSAVPTIDPDYSAWGKDTSAVNYIGLIPYLIKSVQEITTELPRHKTPISNITPRNVEDFVGMIVSKRGSVEISNKNEDKACFGVISEISCDTENNEVLVNYKGEGRIWITNINGNVEAGDLITTSNIAGYGELQNSPILSNFTVAKLTEDCDFNPPSVPIRRVKQEMSNVTVYSVTREVTVTEEEYNELAEEDRTTENVVTYFDNDKPIEKEIYENSTSNTLRTEIITVFKLIHRHTSKTMREGYTPEVRQEMVNVLDEYGQLQWEDTEETEKAYKIRYLTADGKETDEANAVHIAAFVGCTYHCG